MLDNNIDKEELTTFFIVGFLLVITIVFAQIYLCGIKDGPLEEIVEGVIEHNTGIEIDLSPDPQP